MGTQENIADVLASEAEATEQGRDIDATYVPNRTRSKDPSQVYSVRLPVDRLEELRLIASRNHVAPSALMRRWVIEQLDRELDHRSRVSETRDELGPDGDEMLVMTRGQFESSVKQFLHDNADLIIDVVKEHWGRDEPPGRHSAA